MKVDFAKGGGLVPAVVQDFESGRVLMLGYMNEAALEETERSRRVTFWSRSKGRLWQKGETSGNFLEVKEIKVDCDRDALLIKARPAGPVCHTGEDTCFGEKNRDVQGFLAYLQGVVRDRKINPKAESYTSRLFSEGINKIAQKVGEEAVELIIEAKDRNNEPRFLDEAADLLFHYLVLLEERGKGLPDVIKVLEGRHRR